MIKVGVVRGGPSPEYDISLKTGSNILSCLRNTKLKDRYKAVDILIDKDGIWHINGIPSPISEIIHRVDVIFNALHGSYGEDGKIQQTLEQWSIPYTGSGPLSSAIGYNKLLAKESFARLGIKTPKHILFSAYLEDIDGSKDKYSRKKALDVLKRLPPPWIVKPLSGGSSMGVHVCKTFEDLIFAFRISADQKSSILVEELLSGKEATVSVVDKFRGRHFCSLPPIEIKIPEGKNFFDYESKYDTCNLSVCPGNFLREEKLELERVASLIHSGLNLSHYSRSDFIVHPKKGIYALEVNTLPGLHEESTMEKALISIGSDMPEFIDHIIKLAFIKNN